MLGVGVFLLVASGVVSLVGTVMFAVAAFRVSVMWGCLVLFVPFAGLVFLVKHWPQAKRGFLVGLAGTALAVVGYFALGAGIASRAQANLGPLAAQMQAEMAKQQAKALSATPRPAAAPIRLEPEDPSRNRSLAVRPSASLRGLSEIPENLTDPAEIRTRDLPRHVGEDLFFVEKDGDALWAKLVAVRPKSLRIERLLHGGSVQYDVPLANIRAVRTDS
jgi:hypothetical protein